MITKFKLFETALFQEVMLCVNNRIGELEDTYDLTIGKKYNIFIERSALYDIFFVFDDNNKKRYLELIDIKKLFSDAKNLEEYRMQKDTEKYNL